MRHLETEWSVSEKVIKGTTSSEVVYVARKMGDEGYWKTKEFSTYSDAERWAKPTS